MQASAHPPRAILHVPILLIIVVSVLLGVPGVNSQAAFDPACDRPGWFPTDFGLKDHHIFWHEGFYYLVSIYLPFDEPSAPAEDRFAYARSADLCNWETLAPVLPTRTPDTLDEKAIWAPFVFQEAGVYYLYYTGVTHDYTQSILLATTSTPDLPDSWQVQEMVFQPDHAGTLWEAGTWADCRDPMTIKVDGLYYLYYSARDLDGAIIGVATAPTPNGPWSDQGSIIPPLPTETPESPTIAFYDNHYYLFYNLSRIGEYYRIGNSPTGPWQDPLPFRPGWAHEVWQDFSGEWLTSYLTNYTVTIAPVTWDVFTGTVRPFVGLIEDHKVLPVIFSP